MFLLSTLFHSTGGENHGHGAVEWGTKSREGYSKAGRINATAAYSIIFSHSWTRMKGSALRQFALSLPIVWDVVCLEPTNFKILFIFVVFALSIGLLKQHSSAPNTFPLGLHMLHVRDRFSPSIETGPAREWEEADGSWCWCFHLNCQVGIKTCQTKIFPVSFPQLFIYSMCHLFIICTAFPTIFAVLHPQHLTD